MNSTHLSIDRAIRARLTLAKVKPTHKNRAVVESHLCGVLGVAAHLAQMSDKEIFTLCPGKASGGSK